MNQQPNKRPIPNKETIANTPQIVALIREKFGFLPQKTHNERVKQTDKKVASALSYTNTGLKTITDSDNYTKYNSIKESFKSQEEVNPDQILWLIRYQNHIIENLAHHLTEIQLAYIEQVKDKGSNDNSMLLEEGIIAAQHAIHKISGQDPSKIKDELIFSKLRQAVDDFEPNTENDRIEKLESKVNELESKINGYKSYRKAVGGLNGTIIECQKYIGFKKYEKAWIAKTNNPALDAMIEKVSNTIKNKNMYNKYTRPILIDEKFLKKYSISKNGAFNIRIEAEIYAIMKIHNVPLEAELSPNEFFIKYGKQVQELHNSHVDTKVKESQFRIRLLAVRNKTLRKSKGEDTKQETQTKVQMIQDIEEQFAYLDESI